MFLHYEVMKKLKSDCLLQPFDFVEILNTIYNLIH